MRYELEMVIDTRSFDLETGKPIPGSGDQAVCQFCGRTHEVHCHVRETATGIRFIVGSSCAKKQGVPGEYKPVVPLHARIVEKTDACGRQYITIETISPLRPAMGWQEWYGPGIFKGEPGDVRNNAADYCRQYKIPMFKFEGES